MYGEIGFRIMENQMAENMESAVFSGIIERITNIMVLDSFHKYSIESSKKAQYVRPAKTPDSWDLAFLIESLFKFG